MWPACEIAREPTATSNTGRCSSASSGAPTIVPCSFTYASICSICVIGVPERAQRHRHRAVDDRHRAAADQLLVLDEREVGLDAGRVAIHQERDRASGRTMTRRPCVTLSVAERSIVGGDRSSSGTVSRAAAEQRLARRPRSIRRRDDRSSRCTSASRCQLWASRLIGVARRTELDRDGDLRRLKVRIRTASIRAEVMARPPSAANPVVGHGREGESRCRASLGSAPVVRVAAASSCAERA